jgi:sugar fermentation stimulation protein A
VRYGSDLVEGKFISRENRFAALVMIDGDREWVHVPNSGRMRELLFPGADVLLHESSSTARQTAYDLVAVETQDVLVSVDSRVPNTVIAEGLTSGTIPGLEAYGEFKREHTRGDSRFDFLLQGSRGEALLEVKGCTLVEGDGLALFPDAPTQRGARHVRGLARAVGEGLEAYVVVVVQRGDGEVFSPNDRTDPAFGDALREASASGVSVLALGTEVTREGVFLGPPVPVDLEAARRWMT